MTTEEGKRLPRKEMPPALAELWERYFATSDVEARNELIHHYHYLVKHNARPFWHKKPAVLDFEDLISAGTIGLMQAIERYDPDKGAAFETYAQRRIYGAILDQINDCDWTPRKVRKNIRMVLKAEETLSGQGLSANAENISNETGLSVKDVVLARQQATRTFILPVSQEAMREIEAHVSEDAAKNSFSRFFDHSYTPNAQDGWHSLLSMLTEQEAKVILLSYGMDETLTKIAKRLGISPNSVSTLQNSALNKLRRAEAEFQKKE